MSFAKKAREEAGKSTQGKGGGRGFGFGSRRKGGDSSTSFGGRVTRSTRKEYGALTEAAEMTVQSGTDGYVSAREFEAHMQRHRNPTLFKRAQQGEPLDGSTVAAALKASDLRKRNARTNPMSGRGRGKKSRARDSEVDTQNTQQRQVLNVRWSPRRPR